VGSGVDLDDVDAARASGGQLHAGIADSAGRGGGALRTVQAAGQDPRAGGLAAAARPAEQVRVVDLVVGDRPAQRPGDVFLADDLGEGVRTIAPVQRQWRRRTFDGRGRGGCNDGLGRGRDAGIVLLEQQEVIGVVSEVVPVEAKIVVHPASLC